MLHAYRCLWIATLFSAMACGASANGTASPDHDTDSVLIVNSGSTNTAGFRIVVERSGQARYTATRRRFSAQDHEAPSTVQKQVPHALLQRLYSDLDAAKPLSALPEPRCMKPASFGFILTVEFNGEKTPDLSCGGDDNTPMQALIRDVKEISALFGGAESRS
ncbi:MAG: hypothetical protein JO138_16830 [Acidobacteriaceae bacterium]|nr:hypothetical protein [Acidobacteriaceae bacterium]